MGLLPHGVPLRSQVFTLHRARNAARGPGRTGLSLGASSADHIDDALYVEVPKRRVDGKAQHAGGGI